MLPMTHAALAALTGTRTRERVVVDAYLGDVLVVAGLPVELVSLTWDSTRQVQCQGTIKVADADGSLAPWALGDALAPGARLQVSWVCEDGSTIPRALLVITEVHPETGWQAYRLADGAARWLPTGGAVSLTVQDTSVLAVRDRLQAKTAPTEATCTAEVRRLLDGIIPVVDESGSSTSVASGTVFERERLDAVDDLLDHAGLVRRTDGAGVMHLLTPGGASVWTPGAGDGGATISLNRSMRLDDVTNAVVAASSGGTEEHVGRAYLRSGVARWDGPLGNRTAFYASPLILTDSQAQSAADTRLASLVGSSETTLTVQCLPHPGLEIHDRITLPVPGRDGALHEVEATVTALALACDRHGPAVSTITVTADAHALTAAVRGIA